MYDNIEILAKHAVSRMIVLSVSLFIFLAFDVYAQETIPGSQAAPGYDYFSPGSVQGYRDIVTRAHTDKVPGWIRKGDMNMAVEDVRYTLDRFANSPKGLEYVGLVATLIKKPSLAVYYFERALKLYPQYAITHAQYGAYLVATGQIEPAIARLKEAVEIDPKLAGAYALLAKAYGKSGNYELARQAGESAKNLGYRGEISTE